MLPIGGLEAASDAKGDIFNLQSTPYALLEVYCSACTVCTLSTHVLYLSVSKNRSSPPF